MAKRRRHTIGIPIIIALIIIMGMMVAFVAYWYVNGNKLRLPGEWYREVDLTKQVQDGIADYLDSATMGDEVDITQYIDEVVVLSKLSITKDGSIEEKIDEASYYEASVKAKQAMEKAVSDLIAKRIEKNYIDTDKSVQELVDETLGMELSDYLEEYGPELMPSLGELNETYGMSGSYTAEIEDMVISDATGEKYCEYAVAADMLVIDYSDGAVVYHLQKQKNDTEEGADA